MEQNIPQKNIEIVSTHRKQEITIKKERSFSYPDSLLRGTPSQPLSLLLSSSSFSTSSSTLAELLRPLESLATVLPKAPSWDHLRIMLGRLPTPPPTSLPEPFLGSGALSISDSSRTTDKFVKYEGVVGAFWMETFFRRRATGSEGAWLERTWTEVTWVEGAWLEGAWLELSWLEEDSRPSVTSLPYKCSWRHRLVADWRIITLTCITFGFSGLSTPTTVSTSTGSASLLLSPEAPHRCFVLATVRLMVWLRSLSNGLATTFSVGR